MLIKKKKNNKTKQTNWQSNDPKNKFNMNTGNVFFIADKYRKPIRKAPKIKKAVENCVKSQSDEKQEEHCKENNCTIWKISIQHVTAPKEKGPVHQITTN